MPKNKEIDIQAAHKYFSVECFNRAWDFIDKVERTPEEDEQMLQLSLASHWHWTQREDYQDKNASIGYWQISRIYALLDQEDNARRYGQLCLQASQRIGVEPFFLGYAYEALARAEKVAGDNQKKQEYLNLAYQILSKISDQDEKKILEDDLETI